MTPFLFKESHISFDVQSFTLTIEGRNAMMDRGTYLHRQWRHIEVYNEGAHKLILNTNVQKYDVRISEALVASPSSSIITVRLRCLIQMNEQLPPFFFHSHASSRWAARAQIEFKLTENVTFSYRRTFKLAARKNAIKKDMYVGSRCRYFGSWIL